MTVKLVVKCSCCKVDQTFKLKVFRRSVYLIQTYNYFILSRNKTIVFLCLFLDAKNAV